MAAVAELVQQISAPGEEFTAQLVAQDSRLDHTPNATETDRSVRYIDFSEE